MSTSSSPRRPLRSSQTGPRRRVSSQRYLVRRIGALLVLLLLLEGGYRVTSAMVGADGTQADDGTALDNSLDTSSGAVTSDSVPATPETALIDSAALTQTVESVASTAPATVDATPRTPTTDDPAKVLIAGDSEAGTFGPYLETLLDDTGVASTTLEYVVSTGLARPDVVDWPAKLRQVISSIDPDIVIITFGGNDAQGLAQAGGNFLFQQPTGEAGGDAEWRAEYGRRVGEVMDYLSSEGRTLIWVGIPNDDNPDVTARMRVQDEVVRGEVAKRPQVVFIDTWKRFSGRDGNWAEYVIDPRDGQGKDVRADDGFHLNVAGAEILALDIGEVVYQELRNRGASF